MRVMLGSEHRYPSSNGISSGRHPREFSSGSGHHLHDLLAKGLAELGHEVLYLLPKGAAAPMPPGVSLIAEPDAGADIYHTIAFADQAVSEDSVIGPLDFSVSGGAAPLGWRGPKQAASA